ncbi:TetR family transcriptional regulator [Streptomyces sp. SLBN-118]|uniref:TetR/AcrR family transcriptional regulator n=1 Tax=Streptomyces sp. SLBN-118 TaxID=2768454 RepID=UPI00114D826E|nr:TetR/AcrR family transcriptional regulator [Streptomyces sp. SLBN-118]TQK42497.1 TetR family transcriptional regulator [Streptomyces sp. SLBN-118]
MRQPSESPRERLLAAAVTCLQEKGYAHTTARDLATVSGTHLASIGYHFGSKEALLNAALAECFRTWTRRVEQAVSAAPAASPREQLKLALTAMIDVFDEMRPTIIGCVESFPPALRSAELRTQLAAHLAETRKSGAALITWSCTEAGLDLPVPAEVMASILIALSEGLMLQWLLDPVGTPTADQVLQALGALAPFLAPDPR